MNRLFLPLVLVGMLFAPLYSETIESPVSGEAQSYSTSAYDILKPTVDCFLEQNFSVAGNCEPNQGPKGLALAGGVGAAAGAVVLALLGFVSIIRKSSAFLTLLAGLAVLAGVGWIGFDVFNANGADPQWGGYGAAGAGLIASLAGMLGMRDE